MSDIYAFIRKMTGHELVSPQDAKALTAAVDNLIDEITDKQKRINALTAELGGVKAEYAEFVKQHEKEVGALSASTPAEIGELVERLDESAMGHGNTEGSLRQRAASALRALSIRNGEIAAELETVKGELETRNAEIAEWEHTSKRWDEWAKDRADRLAAAEAKLAGGEAVAPMHPMGPKQTIIQEVWQRLEGPFGLMRNVDRSIIEKGVEVALHILRRNGVTIHPAPTHNDGSGEAVASEWHRADNAGSILLFTLMQQGWRKGEPIMVNDVMVRIENANGSQTPIEPIASAILEALSHTSGEVTEDDVAARMWKAEAEDCGAPASVAENRTRAAFDDQASDLKDRWRKFARAAIAALRGEAS